MTLLDFLALTLAGGAVVDVWFNGSIFTEWLAYFQATADGPPQVDTITDKDSDGLPQPWAMRTADRVFSSWFAQMLTCVFCFSYWAIILLAVVFFIPAILTDAPWNTLFKLPVYGLAAIRVGNLLNGILPTRLKYDRNHDDTAS